MSELICLEFPANTAADPPSHAQIHGLKVVQCDHFTGIDIEQARELVRRWNCHEDLVKALEKYGEHAANCDIRLTDILVESTGRPSKCTCGFEAALAAVSKEN